MADPATERDHHQPVAVPGAVPRRITVNAVLGSRLDPVLERQLHVLDHAGLLERVVIATADLARRRLRATGSLGTEFLIALPRDTMLFDGAVIAVGPDHAAVVRVEEERWLRLVPRDSAAALELGYHAGNLHWRVRFLGAELLVALEGPEAAYLERIAPLLSSGGVRVAEASP